MKRYTIKTFATQFPTDDACLDWLKQNRWPDGITCAKCQRVTKHYKAAGRPAYVCEFCGKMVSPMAGTIMAKPSTPLRSWFHAMFLMASTRCGISAKQLGRELGVTYKTTFPISSCLDPDNAPCSTRAIVITLTNTVKHPIKPTNPSGRVVNWCSVGSGGDFHYVCTPFELLQARTSPLVTSLHL